MFQLLLSMLPGSLVRRYEHGQDWAQQHRCQRHPHVEWHEGEGPQHTAGVSREQGA